MPAPKLTKCRGLYTASNRYDVPEGALVTANNILIYKDGVIQPRWGLVPSATSMVVGNVSHWHRAAELNGTLWYAGRDTVANLAKIGYANPTSFSGVTALSIATEDSPDGYANFTSTTTPYYDLEFVRAGNLLYYNCARGLVRIESTGTQRVAGNYPCAVSCTPRPLNTSLSRSGSTTVTATTAISHGYVTGLKVTMTSAGDANFGAGEYTIVTVPSATTFTYVDATSSGTATLISQTFAASNLVGSSGFMSTNDRVAYRALIVEYDTNGKEYVGEVSGRVIVTNASPFVGTANGKNVQLAVIYPAASLAGGSKIELYRSKPLNAADPTDEMWLVYSKFLSQDDITRGYFWITDINPATTAGYGKALYANGTQDGLFLNNGRPAGAKTVALWKDRLVQANTFDFPMVAMQLKSVDSSSGGLVANDYITINRIGATYKAIASGTAFTETNQFTIFTGGTSEIDVKHTVLSFLDSLNWGGAAGDATTTISPMSGVIGYYTSPAGDWPGQFTLLAPTANQDEVTSVNYLGSAITAKVAGATTRDCFAPKLGAAFFSTSGNITRTSNVVTVTTSTTHNIEVGEYVECWTSYINQTALTIGGTAVSGTVTAVTSNTLTFNNSGSDGSSAASAFTVTKYLPRLQNNHQLNNLRASKPLQFEAFPPETTLRVGNPGHKILKCVPCKDSLMVFKEDGLFRVTATGQYGEYLTAELVDPNAVLWAKDSAVPVGGIIMAWLTKGVAIINEQGVQKYASKGRIDDRLSPTTTQLAEPDLLAYPFSRRAQAFVDEKHNLYELRVCLASGPSVPYASTVNLVYNLDNDTWVEDDLVVVSEVFYQGKRYIQQGTTFYAQDNQVYAGAGTDVIGAFAAFASSGNDIYTVPYSGSAPTVGSVWVGADTGSIFYITAASAGTATLYAPNNSAGFLAQESAWAVYNPVVSTIQWAPVTFGAENQLKLHKELEVLFGVREMLAAEVTTSSEMTTTTETNLHKLDLVTTSVGVNGYAPYNLRATVPQQHRLAQQLSVQLVIRAAYGAWTILGVGCDATVKGPRINRGNL